ncbi:hypothetical protein [Streptomyces sp. NPDC001139]
MSPLVSRGLLLPSVVCAALVLGPAGTAAATTGPRTAATETAVAQPSVPDAPTIERADVGRWLDGAKRLPGTEALHPLLGVLTALDARHGDRLGAQEATDYRKAIETSSASLVRQLREHAAPTADGTTRAAVRADDPISDVVEQIQAAISDLLKGLGSLDLGSALTSVTDALSPILSLVTGLLGGGTPSLPTAG